MPHLGGRCRETHFIRCQHLLNCDEHIQCLGLRTAWKRPIAEALEAGEPRSLAPFKTKSFWYWNANRGQGVYQRSWLLEGQGGNPHGCPVSSEHEEALRMESRGVWECWAFLVLGHLDFTEITVMGNNQETTSLLGDHKIHYLHPVCGPKCPPYGMTF